jgi:hypothetical protein
MKESRSALRHELEINTLSPAINALCKVVKIALVIAVDEHFVSFV